MKTNNIINRGQPRRRGMALVGVMMIMLLLLAASLIGVVKYSGSGAVAGSYSAQSSNALQITKARIATYRAQNLADTGVRAVMQWLNLQGSPPTGTAPFRPSSVSNFFGVTGSGNYDVLTITRPDGTDEGTVAVRVYPFSDNETATTRQYVIESIGTHDGKQQVVRAVASQDTFAKYAFFAENAPVNTYFSFGTTVFNGPVHINGTNMDPASATYNANAKIQILWKDNGTASSNRIFRFDGDNSFTTSVAENKVDWYRNNRTNKSNPSSSSDWNHVAVRGSNGVRYAAPKVEMPEQSTKQKDAALGTPPTDPGTSMGVTIPNAAGSSTGGIYINGDVDTMVFGSSGTNNAVQTITVYQTENGVQTRTTITIDPYANSGSGQIRMQKATATANNQPISTASFTNVGPLTTIGGTGNGVIYVAGNIGSQNATGVKTGGISGSIANNVVSNGEITRQNNLTLVTDADKSINVNGSLTYRSKTGSTPNVNSGVFGIVTKKLQITEYNNSWNSTTQTGTALGSVSLDATVFAFDTFDAQNAMARNYLNVQTFTLTGGYIVNTSGTFAGIDASGATLAGFRITRNYDDRLANRPPPFFPSTSNQYKLRSYQRVGSTL